jgi:hypothetical protein
VIQVHGELDGRPYRVVLTGDASDPVQGSKVVRALVEDAVERKKVVLASPTGPRVQVKATDTDSLLHLLAREGRVLTVTGNTPAAVAASGVVS